MTGKVRERLEVREEDKGKVSRARIRYVHER